MNTNIKHVPLLSTITLCAFLSACGGGGGGGGDSANIQPPPNNSVTQPITPKPVVSPDFWLFNANPNGITNSSTPLQLWATDGTTDGTDVLKTSTKITQPRNYFAHLDGGKKVVFMGQDSTHGREPFISDGTAAGTRIIKDITPGTTHSIVTGQQGSLLISANNKAYFTVYGRRNNIRISLYETDGTSAGTKEILNNKHVYTDPSTNHTYSINYGGTFYRTDMKNLYVNLQGSAGAYKVFKISQTTGGRATLTPVTGMANHTRLIDTFIFNGHRYGTTLNGTSPYGRFVKITDSGATAILPNLVYDTTISKYPSLTPTSYINRKNAMFSSNDKINIVAARDVSASGQNTIKFVHFKKDGSTAITSPKFTNNAPLHKRIRISSMFVNDKGLYISLTDLRVRPRTEVTLRYPFKSNGELSDTPTTLSVGKNASVNQGGLGYKPNRTSRPVNNTLVFNSFDSYQNVNTCEGEQLWSITDDTTIDRIALTNKKDSNSRSCPRSEILFLGGLKDNSLAVFASYSGVNNSKGRELWVTDGTTANTKMLKDIAPGLSNTTKNGVTLQ